MTSARKLLIAALSRLLGILLLASSASAYSVLTHEAIIDSAWDDLLKPALTHRFPRLTPDQLIEAHSYAYGGAIIQDMGYYPFGSKPFSDLVHYIRSGDFVVALLRAPARQVLRRWAVDVGAMVVLALLFTVHNKTHAHQSLGTDLHHPHLFLSLLHT